MQDSEISCKNKQLCSSSGRKERARCYPLRISKFPWIMRAPVDRRG